MSTISFSKSQINQFIKKLSENDKCTLDTKEMMKIFNQSTKVKETRHTKSAYMLFLDKYRASLSDDERKNVTQIAKNGGAAWKALSDKEKEPFNLEAKKIKDSKLALLPKKNKRPPSAYLLFLSDFRENLTDLEKKNVTEVAKKGGAAWKALSDKKKTPYIEKAAALKPVPNKVQKVKKPRNSYQIFVAEYRANLSDAEKNIGMGEISKKAASKWKLLENKQPYILKAEEEKKKGKQIY